MSGILEQILANKNMERQKDTYVPRKENTRWMVSP